MIQIEMFEKVPETGNLRHVANITPTELVMHSLNTLRESGMNPDAWEWFSPGYGKDGKALAEIPTTVRHIAVWGRLGGSEGYILEIGGVTRDGEYVSIASGKTFSGMDFVLKCAAVLTKAIQH